MVRFLFPRALFIFFLFAALFAAASVFAKTQKYPDMRESLPVALNVPYSDPAFSIRETLEARRAEGTNGEVQERAVFKRGAARRAPEPIARRFTRWRAAFTERTEQLQEKIIVRRVERFSVKLARAAEKLDRQYARILLYLDKRSAAWSDVSEVRSRLTEADAAIADARRAVAAFPDSLRSVASMDRREAEVAIHARVQETKAALRAAHTALREVLQSLENKSAEPVDH